MMQRFEMIRTLLLGTGVSQKDLTIELPSDVWIAPLDESCVPTYVSKLLEYQQQSHILVATRNPNIASICQALNAGLTPFKLVLWMDGSIDSSEMEKLFLHTEENVQYFPLPTTHPAMFQSNHRVLIAEQSPTADDTELLRSDGVPWGVLLSERFRLEEYCGTLREVLPTLTAADRMSLLDWINRSDVSKDPDNILLFHAHETYLPVQLQDAPQVLRVQLELFVLSGLTPDAPADVLLQTLSRLPDADMANRLATTFCHNIVFS